MARAPISVVIPTLNTESALAPCLGALGEGLNAGLIREVIITDGGSTDGTVELADQAGAMVVKGDASRGGQLRRGCEAAHGAWLLIVHADSWLEEGWTESVLRHLESGMESAGYFRLRFRAKGLAPRIVENWANMRSRLFGLPYGDQGLLIRRDMYDVVGGYADIPLMEDVAIARNLKGKLAPLPATINTAAERYLSDGWVRRSLRNGLTLMRYLLGVDPERLRRDYSSKGN